MSKERPKKADKGKGRKESVEKEEIQWNGWVSFILHPLMRFRAQKNRGDRIFEPSKEIKHTIYIKIKWGLWV